MGRVRAAAHRLALLLLAIVFAGCPVNRVPRAPVVDGPKRGQPGDTLLFWARSVDPDGGNLVYLFDWGDGTGPDWSAELVSGDTMYRRHSYEQPGSYRLQVLVRDKQELESDWSSPLPVAVEFLGPQTPDRPLGPERIEVHAPASFSTRAEHVRGESVSVQFDWSESLAGWSRFVAAGTAFVDSHAWQSAGDHSVRARARDREGNTSPWSSVIPVTVVDRPLVPPTELGLAALDGTSLILAWETGYNTDSAAYDIWFRPLGRGLFELAGTVQDDDMVHNPRGRTGHYTVSVRLGGTELFSPETVTTVPVFTDTLILTDPSLTGSAGYGWESPSGAGAGYSMRDSSAARDVDLYFTDYNPGHTGPAYFVASPVLGPADPAGTIPGADWRDSRFSKLWGQGQEPLPGFDSLLYERLTDVSVLVNYLAVFRQDGYYALIRTEQPDPENGTVRLVSWFQPIRGLRLLQHEEPAR